MSRPRPIPIPPRRKRPVPVTAKPVLWYAHGRRIKAPSYIVMGECFGGSPREAAISFERLYPGYTFRRAYRVTVGRPALWVNRKGEPEA